MREQYVLVKALVPDVDSGAHPEHPIVIPPEQPEQPPTDAHPEHPIVLPPVPPDIGLHPEHPIVLPPEISGPPGPWPSPPIYLPPAHPEHPIVIPPDGDGLFPEHPIVIPPPVETPPPSYEHPDLPNLNDGTWLWIQDADGNLSFAFVLPAKPHVLPPIAPQYPAEDYQPGEWVQVGFGDVSSWAWKPSMPEAALPDVPVVNPLR